MQEEYIISSCLQCNMVAPFTIPASNLGIRYLDHVVKEEENESINKNGMLVERLAWP